MSLKIRPNRVGPNVLELWDVAAILDRPQANVSTLWVAAICLLQRFVALEVGLKVDRNIVGQLARAPVVGRPLPHRLVGRGVGDARVAPPAKLNGVVVRAVHLQNVDRHLRHANARIVPHCANRPLVVHARARRGDVLAPFACDCGTTVRSRCAGPIDGSVRVTRCSDSSGALWENLDVIAQARIPTYWLASALFLGASACGDGGDSPSASASDSESDSGSDSESDSEDPDDSLPECGDDVLPPALLPAAACEGEVARVSWFVEPNQTYGIQYAASEGDWVDAEFVDLEAGVAETPNLGPGEHAWRGRALTEACRSVWSPAIPFAVQPAPALPPLSVTDVCEGMPTVASWTPDELAQYVAQVDTGSGWTDALEAGPSEAQADLPPGIHPWRLIATVDQCRATTPEDMLVNGTVSPSPALPTMLSTDGPLGDGRTSVTLAWQGPDTGVYELEVEALDGTIWTETHDGTDGTSHEFDFGEVSCLRPGEYRWRVKHSNMCGETEFAEDDSFLVAPPGAVESWTRHDIGLAPSSHSSLWGTGAEVWALGTDTITDQTAIAHYDGRSWDSLVLEYHHHGIWGTAPDDVWLFGNSGDALRFDGSLWLAAGPEIKGMWGHAPDDLWAIPYEDASITPRLIHWDGVMWSDVPLEYDQGAGLLQPALMNHLSGHDNTLYAVAFDANSGTGARGGSIQDGQWMGLGLGPAPFGSGHVLALGSDAIWFASTNSESVLRWNGIETVEEFSTFRVRGMDGPSEDNLWLTGQDHDGETVFRRDCEGWQVFELPQEGQVAAPTDVWLESGSDVWIFGHGAVAQGHTVP